jgi:hypothetical protein
LNLKTLLIGDNPFIGVSHLSQAWARDRAQKLDIEKTVAVIDKALSSGASGYTFSIPHPTNLEILKTMKKGKVTASFGLYPVLPYAEGYVRAANERGMAGLATMLMSKMLRSKAKVLLKGGIAAVTFDAVRMLKSYVDFELNDYLNAKPNKAELRTVFLHEVIVDLALSFGLVDLLNSYIEHVHDNYHTNPGFVTRNFGTFVESFQEKIPLKDVVIMAPFNAIGFQMNPSKQSCEKHLAELTNGNVIAVSVLAAGYLRLNDAIEYIKTLPNLSGVAVGVSSVEHAEDTFTVLRTLV